MLPYHKIQTVFKRDIATKYKTLIYGDYSLPEFEYLKDNEWVYTEKVDGTNIRIMYDGETISFGGKTDNAQIPSFLVNQLNTIFLPQILTFRENFDGPKCAVCFYGEGYGAKIQKGGGHYRKDQSFVLFDVRVGEWWLQRTDVEEIGKQFGLDVVPIIGSGSIKNMVEMTMTGFDSAWGTFRAEGIVARPSVELKARNDERIITKIKHKDFQHERIHSKI